VEYHDQGNYTSFLQKNAFVEVIAQVGHGSLRGWYNLSGLGPFVAEIPVGTEGVVTAVARRKADIDILCGVDVLFLDFPAKGDSTVVALDGFNAATFLRPPPDFHWWEQFPPGDGAQAPLPEVRPPSENISGLWRDFVVAASRVAPTELRALTDGLGLSKPGDEESFDTVTCAGILQALVRCSATVP
jgi:hypothetical protein